MDERFGDVRAEFQSAYLGYGGVAEFAGQGYMTEAPELVVRDAFTRLRLHHLEANIQPGNRVDCARRALRLSATRGSRRATEVRGRWRDHEPSAIRTDTWRASRRDPRPS